jgi:hypothetical protein
MNIINSYENAFKDVLSLLSESMLARTLFITEISESTLSIVELLNDKEGAPLLKGAQININQAY